MNRSSGVAPPEAAELRQYTFLQELGRGGSAVVYLALDREARQPVAIKLLQPTLSADEETLQRFALEARTAALLQHPHVVGVHAVKRLRSGGLALIMQYVPGGTLKDLIRTQAPLPLRTVEKVVRDVASALAYAHDKGVVHRDVKPENIFVDAKTGAALLADFGIARSSESVATLTLQGIAVGTPAYMAPEQIDRDGVDGRADIYSLALVAWEMLTGQTPWEGESLYGVIHKQKYERLPSPATVRSDVPDHLCSALERALAKNPLQRFPTARAFADALSPPRLVSLWNRLSLAVRAVGTRKQGRRGLDGVVPAPQSAAPAAGDMATVRFVRSAGTPHFGDEPPGPVHDTASTVRFVRTASGAPAQPPPVPGHQPTGPRQVPRAPAAPRSRGMDRPAAPRMRFAGPRAWKMPAAARAVVVGLVVFIGTTATLFTIQPEATHEPVTPAAAEAPSTSSNDGGGSPHDSSAASEPARLPEAERLENGGWFATLLARAAESPLGQSILLRWRTSAE